MVLVPSMNTSKEFASFIKNKTIYRPPSCAKIVISQILLFSASPEDILLSTEIYWNAPVIIHSSYKLQTSCNKQKQTTNLPQNTCDTKQSIKFTKFIESKNH